MEEKGKFKKYLYEYISKQNNPVCVSKIIDFKIEDDFYIIDLFYSYWSLPFSHYKGKCKIRRKVIEDFIEDFKFKEIVWLEYDSKEIRRINN